MNRIRVEIARLILQITLTSLIINGVGFSTKAIKSINGGGVPLVSNPVVEQALAPVAEDLLAFVDQRLAAVYPVIQKFKNIITSDPLDITKTWVGSDICNYKGFYCESPPDNKSAIAVASVDFNGFHLSAPTLDGFLDQLPDLALFHANSNNFSGKISPNIANLPYLYELDISNNQFFGPFPTAILSMNSLSFLDIRFNSFAGSVPPQLFTKELDALFINNNNFMTRLPENICSTRILYLTLANNKFFGPIPRGIFKALSTLNEVLLLNNLLTGCLPYEVGFLKEAVIFDAGNNRLTGPIPFSFACLDKLEILNLAGNMFYGMVPDMLCALGNLANLSLSDNYFTTIGPICFSLIKKGILDVRNNCIPGLPFQRSSPECFAFYAHPRYCPHAYKATTFAHVPCWFSKFKSSPSVLSDTAPSPF